ncbi:hypothetical protein Cgig2_005932 [Carnegiea gigantea]|uniref:Uncharacterized protein n=1 Tax=Carnegiea gigantea TaxID=171969 RepID=A0A9Q1KIW8_9CARY|nr:hypothetical protein Cgig2_005932 [Carnegiea gigantea]
MNTEGAYYKAKAAELKHVESRSQELMKELQLLEDQQKDGKDIRDLVVHYKDKVIRIMNVEMEKYNCIELFRDARPSVKASGASAAQSLPQIVTVESKKNVRMVNGVEDLTESQANIWADSLIVSPAIAFVKPMGHRPVTRSVANFPIKPTSSSQSRPYESPPQPKSTSLKKSCKYPAKPTSTSSPKPTAKASPPVELKVKGKSSYYLPISPSPSPQSKADYTPLQSTVESTPEHSSPLESTPDVPLASYPSRPQTRSCLKKPDSTLLESTPNPSKPDFNPKHSSRTPSKPNCNLGEPIAAPSKPHTRSQSRDDGIHTGPSSGPKKLSSSNTSKCLPLFNPLSLAVLGVDELLDFDVGSLCREPQWEVKENEWDDGMDAVISIVGAQAEGGRVIVTSVDDNPPSDDDSEDEDFVVDG